MRRNVAVCLAGFAFYWFQRWAGLLLLNLFPADGNFLNLGMLVLSFGCLVSWNAGMRREGGNRHHRHWPPLQDPDEMEHLLKQLDSINARLKDDLSR